MSTLLQKEKNNFIDHSNLDHFKPVPRYVARLNPIDATGRGEGSTAIKPPPCFESTHHSFLIRGISREHENSKRKGWTETSGISPFLRFHARKSRYVYVYIYFRSNPREPQGSPLIVGGVCVLAICQRTIIDCEINASSFFFFFCYTRVNAKFLFRFYPGLYFCADIMEGWETVTSYQSIWSSAGNGSLGVLRHHGWRDVDTASILGNFARLVGACGWREVETRGGGEWRWDLEVNVNKVDLTES